jgi:transposase-like protein
VFWRGFLRSRKTRGLGGMRLVTSDEHAGLVAALRRAFQRVTINDDHPTTGLVRRSASQTSCRPTTEVRTWGANELLGWV